MKRPRVTMLLVCVAVVAAFTACHRASAQTSFAAQRIVDDFVALQPSADLKRLAEIMRGSVVSNRFDANQYFTVLNKLRPDTGLVLDWVYWSRGIGGLPVLYVRKTDMQPFSDFKKYVAQATNAPSAMSASDTNDPLRFGYIERIHVADSSEGFFQLVVLRLLGDRFHMFWHEYYNETFLVCSKQGWERLLQREQKKGEPYRPPPPEFITAATKTDFAPRIRMGDGQVEVNVTTYGPFEGLNLHGFEISRGYPHRILKHTETNLLSHTQDFVF